MARRHAILAEENFRVPEDAVTPVWAMPSASSAGAGRSWDLAIYVGAAGDLTRLLVSFLDLRFGLDTLWLFGSDHPPRSRAGPLCQGG